jgi:general secretion pathway protein K
MLLSLVAASFMATIRTDINLTRNLIDNAEAEALADAGIYRAILALLEPDPNRRWRVDGRTYRFDFHDGVVWISIQDEGGKIDLNKGKDRHLEGLFMLVGGVDADEAAALVDAIVDFRDEDDLHRLNGAEDDDYHEAGLPYGAKDAPFAAVEELTQVMGMTHQLYGQVAPYLTVYSERPQVDLLSAPREVLLAVPEVLPVEIEYFLEERARMEGPIPTRELQIPTAPRKSFALSEIPIYTVRAQAHTESGAVFVREAIVELTQKADRPFRFHAWKQGTRAPAEDNEAE